MKASDIGLARAARSLARAARSLVRLSPPRFGFLRVRLSAHTSKTSAGLVGWCIFRLLLMLGGSAPRVLFGGQRAGLLSGPRVAPRLAGPPPPGIWVSPESLELAHRLGRRGPKDTAAFRPNRPRRPAATPCPLRPAVSVNFLSPRVHSPATSAYCLAGSGLPGPAVASRFLHGQRATLQGKKPRRPGPAPPIRVWEQTPQIPSNP